MHLVRFYLPLHDNTGEAFPAQMLADVSAELSGRFGGVTAHLLSPASGLWRDGGDMHADDVVIFEVFTQKVDRGWWTAYRERLAEDFRQKSILMLLQPVEVI
ncbi:MAG: hypothetical protein WCJ41_12705 [Aestuariivirga sp.]|uniref:hypothetical protein n=1 Tax=Aestuariivirga sp. TaxID=2650926 RepID=UPI0030179917